MTSPFKDWVDILGWLAFFGSVDVASNSWSIMCTHHISASWLGLASQRPWMLSTRIFIVYQSCIPGLSLLYAGGHCPSEMSKARLGEQSRACHAWVEDLKLARAGCATCCSSHLLHTLCSLNLLDGGWRQQPLDWLLGRLWEEGMVQQTLDTLFKALP